MSDELQSVAPGGVSVPTIRPAYGRVLATFFRNSLLRELSFRSNFWITLLTRGFWFGVQLLLFDLIYRAVPSIKDWNREEYFGFLATVMIINALTEAFFMPNCANFSELIRTGQLDFALLKPIDPQFLVSFEKMDLPMLTQVLMALGLLSHSLSQLGWPLQFWNVLLYLLLICGAVLFYYSLMLTLACLSIFFGRNQGLLDFWFYVTVFARYPSNIYSGSPAGEVLRFVFSYVLPILLVMTVPARVLLGKTLEPTWVAALALGLVLCYAWLTRRFFLWSLKFYRSASS